MIEVEVDVDVDVDGYVEGNGDVDVHVHVWLDAGQNCKRRNLLTTQCVMYAVRVDFSTRTMCFSLSLFLPLSIFLFSLCLRSDSSVRFQDFARLLLRQDIETVCRVAEIRDSQSTSNMM